MMTAYFHLLYPKKIDYLALWHKKKCWAFILILTKTSSYFRSNIALLIRDLIPSFGQQVPSFSMFLAVLWECPRISHIHSVYIRFLWNNHLTENIACLPVYSQSATNTYHQHNSWRHAVMIVVPAPIWPVAACRHMLLSAPKKESVLIGGMLQMAYVVRSIHFQKWTWLHKVWGVLNEFW